MQELVWEEDSEIMMGVALALLISQRVRNVVPQVCSHLVEGCSSWWMSVFEVCRAEESLPCGPRR